MRILGAAVDIAQECRVEALRVLAKYGYTAVKYPDMSTEANAKAVIKSFIDGNPPSLLGEKL